MPEDIRFLLPPGDGQILLEFGSAAFTEAQADVGLRITAADLKAAHGASEVARGTLKDLLDGLHPAAVFLELLFLLPALNLLLHVNDFVHLFSPDRSAVAVSWYVKKTPSRRVVGRNEKERNSHGRMSGRSEFSEKV
jgi:hypothetical protein